MTILGIETATSVCAAALVREGKVVAEAALESGQLHAERLVGQVDEVLRRAGVGIRSVDVIAVSIGPGSFTGLRIGVSVSKGLAYAASIPLIGVPTLGALARHAAETDRVSGEIPILAAIDARRDEVYCQLFAGREDQFTPAWDAAALTVGDLRERIGERRVIVTGDGAGKVIGTAPDGLHNARAASANASRCSATAVARLGEELVRGGVTDDAGTLEPRYIKDFFLKTR